MNLFQPSKEAVRLLRTLQKKAAQDNPYDVPSGDVSAQSVSRLATMALLPAEDREQYARGLIQLHDEIRLSLPTEYEESSAYFIIGQLLARLVTIARHLRYPIPDKIAFGTVNSLDLNTHIIPVDKDGEEYLLVFNRALIPFCLLFSEFLASCLKPVLLEQSGKVELALEDRAPTTKELLTLHDILGDSIRRIEYHYDADGNLDAILMDRTAFRPKLSLTRLEMLVRDIILQAMEHFAVGHELGHLILPRSILPGWHEHKEIDPVEESYLDEHLCDTIGQVLGLSATYSLFHESTRSQHPESLIYPISVTGGPLFLACLRLAEKASYMVRYGSDLPEEIPDFKQGVNRRWKLHPPTFLRIAFLADKIKNEIDPQFNQDRVPAFIVFDWANRFLDRAWSDLRDSFRNLHLTRDSFN